MKRLSFTNILFIFFLFSCSSSNITHSWKAVNVPYKKFNKIIVIGINGENSVANKEKMELELVDDLKNLGYNAVASTQEFGPKSFRSLDEDAIIKKLQGTGYDAIITIVLLSKEKERYYVPAQMYYSPFTMHHRYFWGYYNTMYSRVYTPGYYVEDRKYFWESNMYDLNSKDLIYSVQTESYNPSSTKKLAHEYGTLIINDMISKNVIRSN